jgi:hypothetical protein
VKLGDTATAAAALGGGAGAVVVVVDVDVVGGSNVFVTLTGIVMSVSIVTPVTVTESLRSPSGVQVTPSGKGFPQTTSTSSASPSCVSVTVQCVSSPLLPSNWTAWLPESWNVSSADGGSVLSHCDWVLPISHLDATDP